MPPKKLEEKKKDKNKDKQHPNNDTANKSLTNSDESNSNSNANETNASNSNESNASNSNESNASNSNEPNASNSNESNSSNSDELKSKETITNKDALVTIITSEVVIELAKHNEAYTTALNEAVLINKEITEQNSKIIVLNRRKLANQLKLASIKAFGTKNFGNCGFYPQIEYKQICLESEPNNTLSQNSPVGKRKLSETSDHSDSELINVSISFDSKKPKTN